LDCGGKRSATPLSNATGSIEKLCRRFALPEHSRTWRHLAGLLLVAVLLGMTIPGHAQDYSIDWHKVAGGGGTSTGGVYAVSGTIGQHDAGGPMTAGNYSLTGGFWALVSVVQTAGAPTLYISHSGNTVTVYWEAVLGWSLEQNANLATSASWGPTTCYVQSTGTTNFITVNPPTGNVFFRLMRQPPM
jgi:hypothetical protein